MEHHLSSPGSSNLIQIAIAVTLLICPFDNLYFHKLLESFMPMLLALQVVAIELVVVAVVINVAVTVVLAVVCALSSSVYMPNLYTQLFLCYTLLTILIHMMCFDLV